MEALLNLKEYRASPVKHADETGWRTDGRNGYAWLFATPTLSVFRFRQSRSAAMAAEVLGAKRLPGVLVVDRYHAYKQCPGRPAILSGPHEARRRRPPKTVSRSGRGAAFVRSLAPALSEAMHLRALRLSRKGFLRRAARTRMRIIAIAHRQARHPAIWKIQQIFHENAEPLYRWLCDPTIPADNNLTERDLRPPVIARKVSFGSQSEAGARTRETMMTILHTLKKRRLPVAATLQATLDALAGQPRRTRPGCPTL